MQSLMQRSPKNVAGVLAAAVVTMMAGVAGAEQPSTSPAAQAAPASAERQRTTATYADWIVECVSVAGRTTPKVCNMAQVTQARDKNVPFSRVAVFYPGRGQPIKLIVQVPVNASVDTKVHIQTSDSDPGIASSFSRCVPGGCFADFELKDDVPKTFGAARGVGRVSFADASGYRVTIPLSFNGFTQALDALAKE
jgi:invasion protein IalB